MHHWQGIDPWIDSMAVLGFLLCSSSCFFVPFVRLLAGAVLALAKEVRPFPAVAHAMVIPDSS